MKAFIGHPIEAGPNPRLAAQGVPGERRAAQVKMTCHPARRTRPGVPFERVAAASRARRNLPMPAGAR